MRGSAFPHIADGLAAEVGPLQPGQQLAGGGLGRGQLALVPQGLEAALVGKAAGSAPRSCCCMSVSTTPGAMETSRAPLGRAACSSATARVKWSSPALAAQ
jgi:hypothetical protein